MRRPQRLLVLSSMHKMVLFSIAALASLAGAAIARTPEPEPAWRKSALAFVPLMLTPLEPNLHRQAVLVWRRQSHTACRFARGNRHGTCVQDVVTLRPGANPRFGEPSVDIPKPT